MKKFLIGSILSAVLLAVPTMASAHSGTVTCNSSGVVFHYNANFASTKTATERVNSAQYTFVVPAYTAIDHTVPLPTTTPVVASSNWGGPGSIPATTLNCPSPPPPPTCAAGDTSQGVVNGVLVCNHTTVVTIPGPVVTVTVPGPPVVPPVGVCPKGTKNIGQVGGVLTCLKTVIKTKTHIKIQWRIKYIEWCPKPPPPGPSPVAG